MRMMTTRIDRLELQRGNDDHRRGIAEADAAWVRARLDSLSEMARGAGSRPGPTDRAHWKEWSARHAAEIGASS